MNKSEYNENLWEGSMLLVDKPKNWTSFDVVNKIRYSLKLPKKKLKVGHAGTLDPLATGLLIICTGKFTKKISGFQGLDKVYTGCITLGATTPSYDAETEVDQEFPIDHITDERINTCAKTFLGKQQQLPPIHSAIKIDGQRAYRMAREGLDVKMKLRDVEFFDFRITNIKMPEVDFLAHCSKGTYIRSLANDFGERLDSGGYLSRLERTAIGDFKLEDAWNLDELINHIAAVKADKIKFTPNINEGLTK